MQVYPPILYGKWMGYPYFKSLSYMGLHKEQLTSPPCLLEGMGANHFITSTVQAMFVIVPNKPSRRDSLKS
jgi:hypothetical protein